MSDDPHDPANSGFWRAEQLQAWQDDAGRAPGSAMPVVVVILLAAAASLIAGVAGYLLLG